MDSRPRSLPRLCAYGVLAAVALGVATYIFRSVPFDLPSYLAWVGIGAVVLGLASTIRPMRFLGIPGRGSAALVAAAGFVVTAACILWPVSTRQVRGEAQRLDAFLPRYEFSEYHEVHTRAPRSAIEEAIRQVSFAEMPLADLLMRIRALASGRVEEAAPDSTAILDMMTRPGTGFLPLDVSEPSELVYGLVGKPWSNEPPPSVSTPEGFVAFAEPGNVRVAFNLRVVAGADGVFRVTSETRTLATDPRARRVFARYWRIIYPGSAIIRKVWLDAIVARAESGR